MTPEPLNVALACFPTFGGSGVIATELALALAERGHRVHVLARDVPVRLHGKSSVHFHEVTEGEHPILANSGAYPVALAAKLVEVASWERIDIIHVHYAVPHATAAYLAREVLAAEAPGGREAPRVVTTVHGTDITAADASHVAITRFALARSDAVTAPSAYLRQATLELMGGGAPVEVIPNFVDTGRYVPGARRPRGADGELLLAHVSNFRRVKRPLDVIAIFAAVDRVRRARLVLIGDGPERSAAERRVRELGLQDRVDFRGKQERFAEELAAADVFLLPSESESFGVAALEAMSCGVPVVASAVGGLPEVVEHGVSGMLAPVGDIEAMASHALALGDAARWAAFSLAARARAVERFARAPAIDRYESLYRRLLT
jgi:L-malate glycosyltransferase